MGGPIDVTVGVFWGIFVGFLKSVVFAGFLKIEPKFCQFECQK